MYIALFPGPVVYHEIVIPGLVTLLPFCITQPVAKEVTFLIFTALPPRLIQSSSRNVHYKDEGMIRLWAISYTKHMFVFFTKGGGEKRQRTNEQNNAHDSK